MLKIVTSFSQFNVSELLNVYREDIQRNGKSNFPNLSEYEQLQYAEEDFLSYLREDFFRHKDVFCGLWVADGRCQAALRMEPYSDGLLLEALSTAQESRRRGFAEALVKQVLEYLRSSKYKTVYSHIDKNNIPSLQLHKKCGFDVFSDFARYIDGTVTQNSLTMCFRL